MTPTSASPDTPMQWHDGLLLGYAPMDGVHEEFVACVCAIQQASDAQLPDALQALADHAVRHFSEEDRWMEESAFPARECHINEHAAVLKSVREVQELLARGDTAVCRRLAREPPARRGHAGQPAGCLGVCLKDGRPPQAGLTRRACRAVRPRRYAARRRAGTAARCRASGR